MARESRKNYCGKNRQHDYRDGTCVRCGKTRRPYIRRDFDGRPILPLPPPAPAPIAALPPDTAVNVVAALAAAVPPAAGAVVPVVAQVPVLTPAEVADRAELERKRIRIRKLHEYLGRRAFNVTEALVDRTITWAKNGATPPDADPEEKELVSEGFAELSKQAFGEHELTPWGKVAIGTFFMGAGKFASTKALPPKQTDAVVIPFPQRQPPPAPAGDEKPGG